MFDFNNVYEVIQQAEPTNRLLQGSSDSLFSEEWVEVVEQDGVKYKLIYMFDDNDVEYEDDDEVKLPEDYPWDEDHITSVEIVEE